MLAAKEAIFILTFDPLGFSEPLWVAKNSTIDWSVSVSSVPLIKMRYLLKNWDGKRWFEGFRSAAIRGDSRYEHQERKRWWWRRRRVIDEGNGVEKMDLFALHWKLLCWLTLHQQVQHLFLVSSICPFCFSNLLSYIIDRWFTQFFVLLILFLNSELFTFLSFDQSNSSLSYKRWNEFSTTMPCWVLAIGKYDFPQTWLYFCLSYWWPI